MIHSVSTYLKTIITKYLRAFLSDSYILNEEVLNDFPTSVRNPFITKFSTDKRHNYMGKPIDVVYTFTPKKMNTDATILIQEEGGKEQIHSNQGIGMDLGNGNMSDSNEYKEQSYNHYDPKRKLAYYQVKHPINKILSIDKYSKKYTKVVGKRIYQTAPFSAKLAQNNNIPNYVVTITYTSPSSVKHDKHHPYHLEGFDATEQYTIDLVSGNIDTLRCLAALMKAIFITMRVEAMAENSKYYLPKISEAGVDQLHMLNDPTHSTFGNQYYYKRFTLNYIISYTLPQKVGLYINQVASIPKYNFRDPLENNSNN